ncbi:MAG: putative nucleotidyltransferase [Candidatus Saganbacteria bacterium]|uniref:Putative nucleotidyltransferase n=1 Tax=Candidatus Saganbacteria bacterium TaxID=2575572 RepID=A0A833L230_UNCSA|nr:MAG: putative nucleotidyltransferase [Candidatus Saganbacteria bacterium]
MNSKLIIKHLKEQKNNIKNTYQANILGLFGSFARREQKSGSDIDILVEFDQGADLFNFISLSNYLEKILGKKIDLVSYPFLRPEIKSSVMKDLKKI